ncbi:MAG: hypothetical protein C4538_09420 [Nitrospiraceae bacterium]|nr:MAG: hypothetical protein C4538_09420 [Nitrospiraceae bacterium]
MKKFIALFVTISFLMLTSGLVTISHADAVTQKIASEAAAKELAAQAGGTYVSGSAVPSLTGTQVALPVISEATSEVIGYVVAEKASLISALNAAGYTSVASAIAAVEAGTAAGLAVGAGITAGTIATGAAIVAGTAALIVSASSGGGSTTSHH